MTRPALRIAAAVLVLGLAGCRHRVGVDAYAPTPGMPFAEAKAVVTRTLEEDVRGAAVNIEVTPEKLAFERGGGRLLRGGGRVTMFYFDSLGKMDLVPKRSSCVVVVRDLSGTPRLKLIVTDPDRARLFMDAMASLSQRGR